MDNDDKVKRGREAIHATELLEPGVAKDRVKSAIKRTSGNLALRGLAAIGRIGKSDSESEPAQYDARGAAEVAAQFAAIEADNRAEFEQKLQNARQRQEPLANQPDPRPTMAALRASFPEPSKPFARLMFQCFELLDDVARGNGDDLNPETLRREELLLRVAALLRDDNGAAVESFVKHVVFLSRNRRRPRDAGQS